MLIFSELSYIETAVANFSVYGYAIKISRFEQSMIISKNLFTRVLHRFFYLRLLKDMCHVKIINLFINFGSNMVYLIDSKYTNKSLQQQGLLKVILCLFR